MKPPGIIKRELEVAFSKHSQPAWFRVLKYIVIGSALYFFGEANCFGSFCQSSLPFLFACIFGTDIKLRAGQKVMAYGSMIKTSPGHKVAVAQPGKSKNEIPILLSIICRWAL